jgi:hypothetical protein
MAGTRPTAGITRVTPITEAAIITVDTRTDTTAIHTATTIPTTARVIRPRTTDIPIGTPIQS